MDAVSNGLVNESTQSSTSGDVYDILPVNEPSIRNLSTTCALCHVSLSLDNEVGNLEAINVCGDCQFLLLEDVEIISPREYPRRNTGSRRRYDGSESVESLFSQQISQMIMLERQMQSTGLEHDIFPVNDDSSGQLVPRASSRITPSGSRRWRRVFADSESDIDSVYAETESNASFMGHRHFHGDVDDVSYSAYGGESDITMDGQSYLEIENFGYLERGSDLESDTDIDPMNAGLYPFNSDYEDENDGEWDRVIDPENMVESVRAASRFLDSLLINRSNGQIISLDADDSILPRNRDRIQEESVAQHYIGDSGNYLDSRGFENLLEHLTETESSRMGAPPAALSFVKKMIQLTIDGQDENLSCVICKESLNVGTVVNQLPCFHVYHPSCILPWLTTRNTCPLCRYELPTDDQDYEERQMSRDNRFEVLQIHQLGLNDVRPQATGDDAVVDTLSQLHHLGVERGELVNREDGDSGEEIPRNRWFFFAAAAAPVVSMVGISLLLWLVKPHACRRWPIGHNTYRLGNGQRRWCLFF